MLNRLTDYGDTITLVPQSGVQFVEYGFDLDTLPRFSRSFIERPTQKTAEDGSVEYELLPNWNDDNQDPNADGPYREQRRDVAYDINAQRALDVYLNQWIPVPFLRIKPGSDNLGNEIYDRGPVDWVRVRVVESRKAHGDAECSHRVVFAFDTSLETKRQNRAELAITSDDAMQKQSFRFVHRLVNLAGFLENIAEQPSGQKVDTQVWLKSWLEIVFREFRRREVHARDPNRQLKADDFPHQLEHVARYITFVTFLARAVKPARVRLINTVTTDPDAAPVDVDLILDIGNSRSCGLLIQSFPNDDTTDLNRSIVLELRDLGAPEFVYREPFESHVELVQAEFGREDLARQSGRGRAFFWPSFVRLGPEAVRRRAEAEGTDTISSLSSPKRYLWDSEPVTQDWRIRGPADAAGLESQIQRTLYKLVNNRGDVIEQLEAEMSDRDIRLRVDPEHLEGAQHQRFSRSSFFTFMLLEVIAQAMTMMNNPAVRRRDREKDSPRRLRRIIMTIPSATPVQEQRIIRSRTEAALKLFWSLMGWNVGELTPGIYEPPEVHTAWDEASSVHLVYLYGEITQKLGGSILSLFKFRGKERVPTDHLGIARPAAKPEPSLRIASIDIGGGTTDLMVTTYFQRNNRALIPVQNFREGFRKAGDDLVKQVIDGAVRPAIEAKLADCGALNPRLLMRELFSDDRPGMTQAEKHLRRQFALKLLRPVALGILSACEEVGASTRTLPARPYPSFFEEPAPLAPGNRILDYLESFAARRGAKGFRLADVMVPLEPEVVVECIRTEFSRVFENIAEAVHKLDADIVLLTGRPSCQPALVSLFTNQLGVGIDRVLPISAYRVGNWYPFRQTGRSLIADPKTTAVVGGMLCALVSKRQLLNFTMDTDGLAMRSTARFIGEIDTDMTIPEERVWFRDDDGTGQKTDEASFEFDTAARLGYRQLPRGDWVSAPLYRVRFKASSDLGRFKAPFKLTLARGRREINAADPTSLMIMQSEAISEELHLKAASDFNDRGMKDLLELKLDTSTGSADGTYWLDSGILWSA